MKKFSPAAMALAVACVSPLLSIHASALTLEELAEKLERLSEENQQLRARIEQLESTRQQTPEPRLAEAPVKAGDDGGYVRLSHQYAYEMLDPTTNINRKQLYLLEQKRDGKLAADSVYLSGAATVIADYQKSNTESKFGYLMRHPTASNQRTKEVSEAVIHSAQVALTGNLGDWVSAYVELLYDPEQSFGSGTITDVNRNQVQVRRGYVLFGNLKESPFYLSLGKMATPFGLTDTPNPFTASTVWHAFGGLAYGINGGYSRNGLNINVMGIQGGAQFRAANVPVDDSAVPSKLNNYAVDVNYSFGLGEASDSLMLGASYLKGSPYCQEFPVTHFNSCKEENGAYDVYARLTLGRFTAIAEYAETEDEWAGTFNPSIPQFHASKVDSWALGGKYRTSWFETDVDISLDFSRFVAGPDGAPWEKQDQIVLGLAGFITPSTKVFGEIIRTEGYAPLNFISGGNVGVGQTHSDRDAFSNILLFGANVAF